MGLRGWEVGGRKLALEYASPLLQLLGSVFGVLQDQLSVANEECCAVGYPGLTSLLCPGVVWKTFRKFGLGLDTDF